MMGSDSDSSNEKHSRRRHEEKSSKRQSKRESRDRSKSRSSRKPHKHRSRSRSRSRSRRDSTEIGEKKTTYRDERESPNICHCLGVFGLSSYTEEKDLRELFTQYGPVDDISIIYDRQTGRSKGYGFVYFKSTEDAIKARKGCKGLVLDGCSIRVDYSLTTQPHAPTPGKYLGKTRYSNDYDDEYGGDDYYDSRHRRSHSYRATGRDQNYDRDYHRDYQDDYKRRSRRYSPYSRHY